MLLALLNACSGSSDDAWTRHTIDNNFIGADGVDLQDIDQDGDMDAVVGWEESGLVIAYENPGAEQVMHPWPAVNVNSDPDLKKVEDAKFADLDGDGSVDSVVSASEMHSFKLSIHWLQNRREWRSEAAWRTTQIDPLEKHSFLRVVTGQLDGIRGHDIVVGTRNKNSDGTADDTQLIWYPGPEALGPEHSNQWRGQKIADIAWINNLQLVDIDADGDNDVVLSDRENGLSWFENQLSTGGSWSNHYIGPNHGDFAICHGVQSANDTFIVVYVTDHLVFYSRNSDGTWRRQDIETANSLPENQHVMGIKGIACGDLDLNGDTDVIVSISGTGSGVLGYLQRNGIWQITPIAGTDRNHYFKSIKHDTLSLTDLDSDGDLDIITTEENGGFFANGLGVVWFENPRRQAED